MPNLLRILKDYDEIQQEGSSYYSVGIIDENDLFKWQGVIMGPDNTPYAGGVFKIIIQLGPAYPLFPPTIHFKTKIYHANINLNGVLCLDILKEKWNPILSISKVLLSIVSLLDDPNPIISCNPEISKLFLTDNGIQKYQDTAREWTQIYAME